MAVALRRRRLIFRPSVLVVGAGVLGALAAGVVWSTVGSTDGTAVRTVASSVGDLDASVVDRPLAAADAVLPVGTFSYTIDSLGSEATGPDGSVITPAALVHTAYRVDLRSDHDWTEEVLSGPGAGSKRVLSNGVLTQYDSNGRVLAEENYGTDVPVVPKNELVRHRIEADDASYVKDDYGRGAERSLEGGRKERTYTKAVAEPEGEHYRSLPWTKGTTNERRVVSTFYEGSGRIASVVETLNGATVYRFAIDR